MPFPQQTLPDFNAVSKKDAALLVSEIKAIIESNLLKLDELLSQPGPFTFDNLIQPIDEMNARLDNKAIIIQLLSEVMETDAVRDAYSQVDRFVTEYTTSFKQNKRLYDAILSIKTSPNFDSLTPSQHTLIVNQLRDFHLSGIDLPQEKKTRYNELRIQLSQLSTTFAENLSEATKAGSLQITNRSDLAGLSEKLIKQAQDKALAIGFDGFVISLDQASYTMVMQLAESRALREKMYRAYASRASDCGPNAGRFDNTPIVTSILAARHELSKLQGFPNFAEYSLTTKMAKSPEDVLTLLHRLLTLTKPIADKEYQEIVRFAHDEEGISDFQRWDLAFYAEKYKKLKFDYNQDDTRQYFPLEKVLIGLFKLAHILFGITIIQEEVEGWHPDVNFYAIYDDTNELRGGFYLDLFARANKRSGAWTNSLLYRRRLDAEHIQYPAAYICSNFLPPGKEGTALLSHRELITLFHEFGHCLDRVLAKTDYFSIARPPRDAVEFPSQLMERFCWEKEVLSMISNLPQDLYSKMEQAKNYNKSMELLRVLELSLLDFNLHFNYDHEKPTFITDTENHVYDLTGLAADRDGYRTLQSFRHIFVGDYAAVVYGYPWADVLSADGFDQFKENGILDGTTGRLFMSSVLEMGGSRESMESFVAFRGREPSPDVFLRSTGLLPPAKSPLLQFSMLGQAKQSLEKEELTLSNSRL